MQKYGKIIEILEKMLLWAREMDQEQRKQEEFEAYIRVRLDKIERDLEAIKKAII